VQSARPNIEKKTTSYAHSFSGSYCVNTPLRSCSRRSLDDVTSTLRHMNESMSRQKIWHSIYRVIVRLCRLI